MRHTALVLLLLAGGCASRRVLGLENRVLRHENAELREQVADLSGRAPPADAFVVKPTLADIHGFLTRAGYVHDWDEDDDHIHLDYTGKNTSFGVDIQIFGDAEVCFVAIDGYLSLDDVQSVDSATLLLVQLATLNYELLLGKFQLDPESGAVLLSIELHLEDGLGYRTFVDNLEHLMRTADERYPGLERALAGDGL